MQHPTTLPLAQQQHLAQAIRKHGATAVARTIGITREPLVRLASGFPCRPGSVALAQIALPALDASLAPHEPTRAA